MRPNVVGNLRHASVWPLGLTIAASPSLVAFGYSLYVDSWVGAFLWGVGGVLPWLVGSVMLFVMDYRQRRRVIGREFTEEPPSASAEAPAP